MNQTSSLQIRPLAVADEQTQQTQQAAALRFLSNWWETGKLKVTAADLLPIAQEAGLQLTNSTNLRFQQTSMGKWLTRNSHRVFLAANMVYEFEPLLSKKHGYTIYRLAGLKV